MKVDNYASYIARTTCRQTSSTTDKKGRHSRPTSTHLDTTHISQVMPELLPRTQTEPRSDTALPRSQGVHRKLLFQIIERYYPKGIEYFHMQWMKSTTILKTNPEVRPLVPMPTAQSKQGKEHPGLRHLARRHARRERSPESRHVE